MPRANRAVAGLGIAVIAFGAVLGIASLDYALLEPAWVLLQDQSPVLFDPAPIRADEQPVPLLSLVRSRAPPTLLAA